MPNLVRFVLSNSRTLRNAVLAVLIGTVPLALSRPVSAVGGGIANCYVGCHCSTAVLNGYSSCTAIASCKIGSYYGLIFLLMSADLTCPLYGGIENNTDTHVTSDNQGFEGSALSYTVLTDRLVGSRFSKIFCAGAVSPGTTYVTPDYCSAMPGFPPYISGNICYPNTAKAALNSACYDSPLIVDVNSNGYNLTDAPNGVYFDLNADGHRDRLAWTAANSDDAWLALDRNGNGKIDDGTELFGNFTAQAATTNPNGFLALSRFDNSTYGGNGDGVISAQDAVFAQLRLWQDVNHNGVSDAGELHTLSSLNYTAIGLAYNESSRQDASGNWFRYYSGIAHDTGVTNKVYDVYLTEVLPN